MNTGKKKIYRIITVILIAVMVFSVFMIARTFLRYRKGQELYSGITDKYVLDNDIPKDTAASGEANETEDNTAPADETADTDTCGIIIPPQIDHSGLLSENPDYIGWLRIEGCGIDLPVVKGTSDEEYLHTGFDRTPVYQGTLFAECQNHSGFSDPNTIIFGHNMKNGSMFGTLKKFLSADFAQGNDTFWLCTADYGYRYRIYSVAVVNENDAAYTLFSDFDASYAEYVLTRAGASAVGLSGKPDAEARTLTLSTCYGTGEDGRRLIVQAYREGVYPAAGCTEEEAAENELERRKTENGS